MALTGGLNGVNRELYLTNAPAKISKHMLIKQHMNAHTRYRRAKSAIDNSCPNSYLTSTKVKDRLRKEKMAGNSRPASARPMSSRAVSRPQSQISAYRDIQYRNPEDPDMMCYNVGDSVSAYNDEEYFYENHQHNQLYNPKRSSRSVHSEHSRYSTGQPTVFYEPDPDPDIIESHRDKFTESKKFKPRTLRYNNVQSKLATSSFYNPPPKKTGKKDKLDSNSKNNFKQDNPTKNDVNHADERDHSAAEQTISHTNEAVHIEQTISENKRSTLNREPSQEKKIKFTPKRLEPGGPSLIEQVRNDPNKVEWIHDQAQRAQPKRPRLKLRQSQTEQFNTSQAQHSPVRKPLNRSVNLSFSHTPMSNTNTMQEMSKEEEELQYLNFVTAVTKDILDKGVFTNRVLNQVIDVHIERNMHLLRMKDLERHIDDLRSKLGIAKTTDEEDPLSSLDRFRYYPEYQTTEYHESIDATRLHLEPGYAIKDGHVHIDNSLENGVDFVDGGRPVPTHSVRSLRRDSIDDDNYDIVATMQEAIRESDRNKDENDQEVITGRSSYDIDPQSYDDLQSTIDSNGGVLNQTMGTQMLETLMTSKSVDEGDHHLEETGLYNMNEDTRGKTVHFSENPEFHTLSITEVSTLNNTGGNSDLNSSFDTTMMRDALMPVDNIPVKTNESSHYDYDYENDHFE